jgi:hypothetical protein
MNVIVDLLYYQISLFGQEHKRFIGVRPIMPTSSACSVETKGARLGILISISLLFLNQMKPIFDSPIIDQLAKFSYQET